MSDFISVFISVLSSFYNVDCFSYLLGSFALFGVIGLILKVVHG